jgi:hypothetical protein
MVRSMNDYSPLDMHLGVSKAGITTVSSSEGSDDTPSKPASHLLTATFNLTIRCAHRNTRLALSASQKKWYVYIKLCHYVLSQPKDVSPQLSVKVLSP